MIKIRINENEGLDIIPNIRLFRDIISVTEFYLLGSFIGKMYSLLLISEPSLSKF